MPQFQRAWWRAAAEIADALRDHHHHPPAIWRPSVAWSEIERLQTSLDLASLQGWFAAACDVRERLQQRLRWLQTDLGTFISQLARESRTDLQSTVSDVYQELVALQEEFDDVTVDRRQKTVTVVTDAITLEEVYLGPFSIVWNWSALGHSDECRVVAEEPNRPDGRDDVTYPHVMDDHLCEGDAQPALQSALRSGRLSDYFRIISRVLETYNPSSAYVELADWTGQRCTWCDDRISEDELSHCEACGISLCDSCTVSCAKCDATGCRTCLSRCDECEDWYCRECLPPPRNALRGICTTCQQKETDHADEDTDAISAADPASADHKVAATAVHAHGLGQVVVPAGLR